MAAHIETMMQVTMDGLPLLAQTRRSASTTSRGRGELLVTVVGSMATLRAALRLSARFTPRFQVQLRSQNTLFCEVAARSCGRKLAAPASGRGRAKDASGPRSKPRAWLFAMR
jgi:hypothetical protein